jgi:hypothetical protein
VTVTRQNKFLKLTVVFKCCKWSFKFLLNTKISSKKPMINFLRSKIFVHKKVDIYCIGKPKWHYQNFVISFMRLVLGNIL